MMAEITDDAGKREGIPVWGDVQYVPFYDSDDPGSTDKTVAALEELAKRYPGRIAGFIFELVQGEGGFNVAPPEFFKDR